MFSDSTRPPLYEVNVLQHVNDFLPEPRIRNFLSLVNSFFQPDGLQIVYDRDNRFQFSLLEPDLEKQFQFRIAAFFALLKSSLDPVPQHFCDNLFDSDYGVGTGLRAFYIDYTEGNQKTNFIIEFSELEKQGWRIHQERHRTTFYHETSQYKRTKQFRREYSAIREFLEGDYCT